MRQLASHGQVLYAVRGAILRTAENCLSAREALALAVLIFAYQSMTDWPIGAYDEPPDDSLNES